MLNLVKNRYIYLWTSAVLSIISVILFFSVNLNLWIDMTWWTQSEYSYTWDAKITEVSQKVKELSTKYNETNNNIINETSAYWITGEQKIYLEWDMIPAEYLNSAQLQTVEDALSFDVAVGHITWETSQKAYLCL